MAPCRDYTLELAPSALFRNVKVKNILDLNSDRFQYRSLFVPRPVHIKKLKFYFKKIIHNVLFNPAHRSTNNQIEAKIVRGSDYLVRGGDYYRVKVGLQKIWKTHQKRHVWRIASFACTTYVLRFRSCSITTLFSKLRQWRTQRVGHGARDISTPPNIP